MVGYMNCYGGEGHGDFFKLYMSDVSLLNAWHYEITREPEELWVVYPNHEGGPTRLILDGKKIVYDINNIDQVMSVPKDYVLQTGERDLYELLMTDCQWEWDGIGVCDEKCLHS